MKIRGTLLVLLAVLALELLIASGGVGWVLRQAESLLGGERLAWAQERSSIQALERAKFDTNGYVKVAQQGTITATVSGTSNATIVSPLSGGRVDVNLGASGITLATSHVRPDPLFLCDEDCATCCQAITDAGATLALAASTIGTYEISIVGAPMSCADGVAPAAVYGTQMVRGDGYAAFKRLTTNLDCITNTGETGYVCAIPCEPTPE